MEIRVRHLNLPEKGVFAGSEKPLFHWSTYCAEASGFKLLVFNRVTHFTFYTKCKFSNTLQITSRRPREKSIIN